MSDRDRTIVANRDACVGSGLCSFIAPNHFDTSDGLVRVIAQQVNREDLDAVAEAVEGCPTQALRLDG